MSTRENIIDAKRFATASRILSHSVAVDQNDQELDTSEITPQYLMLEIDADGEIVAFDQCESFADAAKAIDLSQTSDVDLHKVVDLDTGAEYIADRRTVAFVFRDSPAGAQPSVRRVEIAPEHIGPDSPGVHLANLTANRPQATHASSPEGALDNELDLGDAASQALADHLFTMGAAQMTSQRHVHGQPYEITVRAVDPTAATPLTH